MADRITNPVQEMANAMKNKVNEAKLETHRVQSTTDYSIFKLHPFNREVDPDGKHVQRLVISIKEHNMLSVRPLLVNEKMEVIDGQHRLEAAKALKVPVYYQVYEKVLDADMRTLNSTQRTWALNDYLLSYSKEGRPDYVKFQEFLNEYGFKVVEGLLALNEGPKKGSSKIFQQGHFKFPKGADWELAQNKLDKYKQVMAFLKKKNTETPAYLKSSNFRTALLRFVDLKSVDFTYFMDRIERKLDSLRMATSVGAYLMLFETIYNYGTRINKLDLEKELVKNEKPEVIQEVMLLGM